MMVRPCRTGTRWRSAVGRVDGTAGDPAESAVERIGAKSRGMMQYRPPKGRGGSHPDNSPDSNAKAQKWLAP
jgi:hypothetical protein